MLDQSFSADNFRRIIDLENRKGVHVEDKLSMDSIRKINERIRDLNALIKIAKKGNDLPTLKMLYDSKKALRDQKDKELSLDLEKICQKVAAPSFKIELKKVDIPDNKPIYTTPNIPEFFFTLKQIQVNVSKLFGIKQASRFSIIDQVKILLGDQFPKYVIRTDIKDFYENIDHKRLLDLINRDNLLSPFSRNIIRSILNDYKLKSGSNKGIPRGIGVSAYLAELFMRDMDKDIKDIEGVTYYARYVDDIIIIFTPTPSNLGRNYLQEVKDIVESKYKISLNPIKTKQFDLVSTNQEFELEYLGYRLFFGLKRVETRLTDKKIVKYKERIKLAFNHYTNYSKVNEKEARNLIVKRIRFLCGNTRLTNNKKNILVGIYYSNSQLTLLDDLKKLDSNLIQNINSRITNQHLKDRLRKYSFEKGFVNKVYSPFTTRQLSDIMTVWDKPF
jgi:hypothetical protein